MATMKLLLKESIKNVGRVGDVVEVSPGYARNYLLPNDLAVQPTPGNIKKVEERRKEIEKQERERREQQAALLKTLEGVEVTLERRANEKGHLFGSVSATDIAKALQAQGYNVEPDDVNLPGKLDKHREVQRADPVRRGSGDGCQSLGRPRSGKQSRDRSRAEGTRAAEQPAAQ